MNTNTHINIFIVDDNKTYSLALKASIEIAFEHIPINIYSFATGEECFEKLTQIKPELIILDYYLNSSLSNAADGLQILHKIKADNSETNVIMLTSNDQIDIALKSFHHGVFDYIVKTGSQFKKINNAINKILTKKEIDFILVEKENKRTAELINVNKELVFQYEEKSKRAEEFNIISSQKNEVEKSKLVIEERNKDITDSINYAKRIQIAKLPKKEEILASLPESFILFKPKDIVSGDFYFFHKTNQTIFIAAADCTGHGVPGALMSMICSEQLMDAVLHSNNASEILNQLNKGIKKSLQQSSSKESTRDGMDIAICSIDLKNLILKYAGANRPLWIIRKGQSDIEEIKGTKKAIGGLTEDDQYFDNHELKLQKGDTFYIFTDGYIDQFGGASGKKVMTKFFREILLSIQDKSMKEQKKHLNSFIEKWKSNTEQVDDILVIGVRL